MSKGLINGHKQLVQSLGQLCQQHISDAFKKFNELCSSNLVGMAARAESNRLQTLYLDSQRLLRKQRSAIEAATIATAVDHFALLQMASPPAAMSAQSLAPEQSHQADSTDTDLDNLKLLGHEDLEVMIALDNCSSRVREELRGALHQLEGRLKSLLDNPVPIKTLPMSPDAILEAFVAAIDEDMIAVEVQLELIRMFDLCCFDQRYTEMLGVANQLLEDAGFSPLADAAIDEETESHEKESQLKPSESAAQQVHTAEYKVADKIVDEVANEIDKVSELVANYAATNDETESSAAGNTRIQTELLAKITSMLEHAERESAQFSSNTSSSGTKTADTSAANISPSRSNQAGRQSQQQQGQSKPCMDKPQLLAEINKHMSDLITNRAELLGNGQITRELSAAIKQFAAGESGSRLHRNDLSLFQVVENIFSSFGQSMVVAPEVQQVINRCELPMLKMAIQKPLILEQENHPIRRLFNEMARYAIGLEQGDCEDNQIYQQMLKLSESMVGESFDEQKLPGMLSDFMAVIDRDKRVTSAAEARELEQIAAQEKVNWARTRVEEEIARRIIGKKLSESVIDFIQHSWCMVMHMAHLRSGEAGSDWLVGIKILENLVHLARRVPSQADIKYRHELLAHIDARLGHISADAAQRALQVKQLSWALGIAEPTTVQSAVVTEIAPAAHKRTAKKASKNSVEVEAGVKGRGDKLAEKTMVEEIKRILVSAVKAELPGKNISQAVRDAESIDSSAQRILMALQKGCWIELGGDIKAHKRGKLAGIVGPSWKYVFVDNKGKLIAERDRARLALELMDGKVTVLDNSHLFDKAIKQAITQIKGLPVAS
tara:strand:- start:6337 stop:8841 length:2505 start_codon:yes stop_codon:yes gene_type:complete